MRPRSTFSKSQHATGVGSNNHPPAWIVSSLKSIGRDARIFLWLMATLTVASLVMVLGFIAYAATNVDWTGTTGTNFETGTNWAGNSVPANDTTTSIGHFTGAVSANQPQITTSRSIAGLLFDTSTGGWTLSSSSTANVLTLGASGISTVGQSSGTNISDANLSLSISQPWVVGAGGTLQIDGTVAATASRTLTLGTGGNTGTLVLNGTNTNFLGHLAVSFGSFGIGNNSALGTGDLTLGGTGANTPTVFASGERERSQIA